MLERFGRTILAAAVAATIPAAVRAQDTTATPEQVAQEFVQATRDTNWARMAGLMHPSALKQFHDLFSPVLQCPSATAAQIRQTLFGIGSTVEAARTSDSALMVALFRTMSGRASGLAEVMRTAQLRVIGHVLEGADTVHVVSRLSVAVDSFPLTQMDVVSMARSGPTWRVLLKADFSALGFAMRRICGPQGG